MRRSVTVHVPAKVNLTLELLGVREQDGYHFLRSLVLPISLYETVSVSMLSDESHESPESSDALSISCVTNGDDGIDVEELRTLPLENQLTVKAARALLNEVALKSPSVPPCLCEKKKLLIEVTKRVPIGAGMGGGSADAAGMLLALNQLWRLKLPLETLADIGATVGSDIPAMMHGALVLMEGTGEKITPIFNAINSLWLVIVFPGIAVSTKDIYRAFNSDTVNGFSAAKDAICNEVLGHLRQADHQKLGKSLFNGLEKTVFRLYPEIRHWRDALLEAGATGALLSGSGSAVFGVARDEEHANAIAQRIGGSVWCRVAKGSI